MAQILVLAILFLIITTVTIAVRATIRTALTKHPMFSWIDEKMNTFNTRVFNSEDEKNTAKEQLKTELASWKSTVDLQKQQLIWRSKVLPFGWVLLKKNVELIDKVEAAIQKAIDSLH